MKKAILFISLSIGVSGLTAVDSLNVRLISTIEIPGNPRGFQLVDTFLYVVLEDSGVVIYDIVDPYDPIRITKFNTLGKEISLCVRDNYAYLATLNNPSSPRNRVDVIDITDIYSPLEIGYLDTNYIGSCDPIFANESYLFCVSNLSDFHGFKIFDLSSAPSISFVSQYSTGDVLLYDLAFQDNHVLLANRSEGLRIVSIETPSSPIQIGYYDYAPVDTWGVYVVENYAYMCDGEAGLKIVNISIPSAPILTGQYSLDGFSLKSSVIGNYLYLCNFENGFKIMDISDPTSPSIVGYYSGVTAVDVEIRSDYAFVFSSSDEMIYVFDISYFTGSVDIDSDPKPAQISLTIQPNPFNSAVSISALEGAEVEIFDIKGRNIATLEGGTRVWKPEASVGSGIYLVRATVGEQEITKRVVYLK